MKKCQSIIIMSFLMAVATACSSGSRDDSAASKEVTGSGSAKGKTVVTMSLQAANPYYQTVEKKFEEKYPDIDLQIQFTNEYEKYQKTTNAALLSGKGPDIFEISSLPIGDYLDKKLLLNMNDNMQQDQTVNKSDLQTNVLDALKLNGGLYMIPSGFFLRAFVGDGDILDKMKVDDKNWTWKQFAETSKKMGQSGTERRYALANDPPEILLQEMMVDHYAQFVDHTAKKATFDSPLFIEAMQQIKKMYSDKVMTSEPADVGKQMFYSTVLRSPVDFVDGLHQFFANPKLLQKPEQTGGTRIVTSTQLAIQAKSQVKEEAWKVITFLLSEEGQSLQEREGFSLLKSVNEKKLNSIQEQVKSGTYKLKDGKVPKVSDEEFKKFKQLLSTADNYPMVDGSVIAMIGDEARAFFGEQKTALEVAKLIQSKATTFLNE
ncbi:extracellular solute-binding protein [Paenibacillus sp. CGMCC 1.16610]|uniref:Extracellular solute-binding protein n=1 Tax=Paenibacillus anseongense TaxID=2682845 RepID=A0ABW9ULS9_9BACL|nr:MULTISPECIES: extracellular solute-binding protein [Paenibacillus]MBA2936694.1 extracellular solute-binding protein [Paenibacillus sp. CGMCC 1.16610]MVQ39688.1 extracellular solute-binding protein [Paenibacillus anseongense]